MLLLIQLNCDCNGFSAWLWPLILAFILGAIFGWLLSKLLGRNSDNEDSAYRQKYLDTKTELDLCRRDANRNLAGASALGASSLAANTSEKDKKEKNASATKSKTNSSNSTAKTAKKGDNANAKKTKTTNTNSVVAKSKKSDAKDDLTKVEGIGPKIQGLLNDDGIWTWKQLSETSVERIQKVLDNAGPRYRVHNPKSWPLQAAMCHNGEWEKLEKWQDEHKGGRM